MSRVWLVRHTRTALTAVRWSGRLDPELTADGRAEAAAVARQLAPRLAASMRIVSSPARRTVELARVLADRVREAGKESALEVIDDLLEVDVGRVSGLTFDEVAEEFPAIADALLSGAAHIDWPDGESAATFHRRAQRMWTTLEQLAAADEVVAVSHGGLIREMASIAIGDGDAVAPLEPGQAIRLERSAAGAWRLAERLSVPAATVSGRRP